MTDQNTIAMTPTPPVPPAGALDKSPTGADPVLSEAARLGGALGAGVVGAVAHGASNPAPPSVDYDALAKQAGAVSSQPSGSVDYDALAKQAGAVSSKPSQPPTTIKSLPTDLLSGLGGGVIETAEGGIKLANKIIKAGSLHPDTDVQIPDIPKEYYEQRNTGEKVGGVLENIGEFAAGDAALKGMSSLVKVPEAALALAEKYPVAAKLIHAAVQNAAVGGAQGAVKGAVTNQAAQGAIGGAGGGAIGGLIGEAASPVLNKILRVTGMGGKTAEEAFTQAGRPSVTEKNFADNVQSVLPRLVEADKTNPVKTVGDFEDLAHDTANTLWKTEVTPQIARHASEVIHGNDIANDMRGAISPEMRELFPSEAQQAEDFAAKFDKDMPLSKAQSYLETLNAKLKGYYKMSPEARHALGATDGSISAMENAADGLRDHIYSTLEDAGEQMPRELRQQYGALKQIERVFGKRATVSDRQAAVNLPQVLSMAAGALEAGGAVLSGHPLAAAASVLPFAVSTASRIRNAPESLIRQGLKAGAEQIAPSAAKAAVGAATKKITAGGAAAAGRELIQDANPDESNPI